MKIIQSYKFKEHMRVHAKEFLIHWEYILKHCEDTGVFNNLKGQFEKVTATLPSNAGYCSLVETDDTDEILYAKRKSRDTYTRFVKNRQAVATNNCTILLNQNRTSSGEYYLVTMYPGDVSMKEPEDRNIVSDIELKECLEFWSNRALIYDESIVDVETITKHCPYSSLFDKVA